MRVDQLEGRRAVLGAGIVAPHESRQGGSGWVGIAESRARQGAIASQKALRCHDDNGSARVS